MTATTQKSDIDDFFVSLIVGCIAEQHAKAIIEECKVAEIEPCDAVLVAVDIICLLTIALSKSGPDAAQDAILSVADCLKARAEKIIGDPDIHKAVSDIHAKRDAKIDAQIKARTEADSAAKSDAAPAA